MVDRLGHDIGCLLDVLMWAVGVLFVVLLTLTCLILAGVI